VTSYEIGVLRRGLRVVSKEGVGLTLAKALLAESQQDVVQDQVEGTLAVRRVTPTTWYNDACATNAPERCRPLGTVKVAAQCIPLCSCTGTPGMANLSYSPLAAALPGRAVSVASRIGFPASTRLDRQLREMAEVLQAITVAESFDNLSRPCSVLASGGLLVNMSKSVSQRKRDAV
jgi:hypothetical protein